MIKAELRKREMLRRRELDRDQFNALNLQLLEKFKRIDFSNVQVVHIFIPIEEKLEPDTFLMINWLNEVHPNIKVIVPKADFTQLTMTHHEYRGIESLQKNSFNILEPIQADSHKGNIDMVFLPLLAFDSTGNRVGYGKGFYDRFLKEHANATKIGVSLFGPMDRIDDAQPHDIRLDACITPEKIWYF